MGLKITSATNTSKGVGSAVYVMINEVYAPKSLNAQIGVKTYKTKAERDADINDTCEAYGVKAMYPITLNSIDDDITAIYALLKSELEAEGKTVVDAI